MMKKMCDPVSTTFIELAIGDLFTYPDGLDHHRKINTTYAQHDRHEGDGKKWQCTPHQPVTKIGESTPTREEFFAVKLPNGEGLGNCDLADEAAWAAASVLVDNWMDAMKEGEKPRQLFTDIGDTICMLQVWRKALEHNYGESNVQTDKP